MGKNSLKKSRRFDNLSPRKGNKICTKIDSCEGFRLNGCFFVYSRFEVPLEAYNHKTSVAANAKETSYRRRMKDTGQRHILYHI